MFGTDGIRGRANQFPVTIDNIIKIAVVIGEYFKHHDNKEHVLNRVIIGKDTRRSGYMIEPALTAAFVSIGIDVVLVGPVPTPAISVLTRTMRANFGVMISASHNPYYDNGIKFFDENGLKISSKLEKEISAKVLSPDFDMEKYFVTDTPTGKAIRLDDVVGRYVEFVKGTIPKGNDLEGITMAIDCANGASYKIAKEIFWEMGAKVIPINDSPDGFNINHNCGSMHPEQLSKKVVEVGADIGIAFDGDADRVVVVDELGNVVDGDQLIALLAMEFKETNYLTSNKIIATIVSNSGLAKYLSSIGLELIMTDVGDKYVAGKMVEEHSNFGGEKSGHLIMSNYCPVSDALIAAIKVVHIFKNKRKKASKLFNVFTPCEQINRNVKLSAPIKNEAYNNVIEYSKKIEKDLEGKVRIVTRKSGTEPVVRLMVEAIENDVDIASILDNLEKGVSKLCA